LIALDKYVSEIYLRLFESINVAFYSFASYIPSLLRVVIDKSVAPIAPFVSLLA
jgi:hypothetical protein